MAEFIETNRKRYGVESICSVLPIAPCSQGLEAAEPRRHLRGAMHGRTPAGEPLDGPVGGHAAVDAAFTKPEGSGTGASDRLPVATAKEL